MDSTNVKSRLRILQYTQNKTFAAPLDATGNITYTYEETFINEKLSSKGLSAGAIVAIVLVCVVAVLAVGLAILFLSRKTQSPPNENIVSNIIIIIKFKIYI